MPKDTENGYGARMPRGLVPPAWRTPVLLALLALAPTGACSCEDETLAQDPGPTSCEPDFPCPQGFAYRLGACQVARCQGETDCCPGQLCSVSTGLCVNRWTACTQDDDCVEIPGQACIELRGEQVCGYPTRTGPVSAAGTPTCATNDDCRSGATCVGRRCLVAAPCAGGCPEGEVCDLDSNTCYPLESCALTCAEGDILVLEDPDTMAGNACCEVNCACATLPSLSPGQFGWHASLASTGSGVAVAAYDAVFGDLVVASFDEAGAATDVSYVDGFPLQGPIVASPAGRRGGRDLPGPDVGEYASIAAGPGGELHVAYYDRSEARLKYARWLGGTWTVHVVDDAGDVGRFTSIAVNRRGIPVIAYMAVSVPSPDGPQTSLRLATAGSPTPGQASDWTIAVADARPAPDPICGGGCERNEACVDLGNGPLCRPEESDCPEPCPGDQVCIASGVGPACANEIDAAVPDDLPEGTGLFASLVIDRANRPLVAYYDRLDRQLELARADETGELNVEVIDQSGSDVGQHVSAALDQDDILALAYVDSSTGALIYAVPSIGLREVIDDGVSPPDLRLVGADASLVFDVAGRPAVAYQDATRLDLMYARRIGDRWLVSTLRSGAPPDLAAGFYASQARRDDRAFVASVAVGFVDTNLSLNLTIDIEPLD